MSFEDVKMDFDVAWCIDEEETEARNNQSQNHKPISIRLQKKIRKQVKKNKRLQEYIKKLEDSQKPIPMYLKEQMQKQEIKSKNLIEKIHRK